MTAPLACRICATAYEPIGASHTHDGCCPQCQRRVAAAPELLAALRKLVGEIDFDIDGARWHPDPGCLECTSGTTPHDRNTGPCGYHQAQALLARGGA